MISVHRGMNLRQTKDNRDTDRRRVLHGLEKRIETGF